MKIDGEGKRHNTGKVDLSLLVPEAVEAECKVWMSGVEKYGRFNWKRGMPWTTVLGCLLRHTFAILRGEDIDPESGELHAAHIKCNATMLIYYYYYYKQGDDREVPRHDVTNCDMLKGLEELEKANNELGLFWDRK